MVSLGERATARLWIVRATFFANSFLTPLGDGLTSPENDGDGFYVAFGFDGPNPDIGGSHNMGVDWNGEGSRNVLLGDFNSHQGNTAADSRSNNVLCCSLPDQKLITRCLASPQPLSLSGPSRPAETQVSGSYI